MTDCKAIFRTESPLSVLKTSMNRLKMTTIKVNVYVRKTSVVQTPLIQVRSLWHKHKSKA